jgi:hypothetical protein
MGHLDFCNVASQLRPPRCHVLSTTDEQVYRSSQRIAQCRISARGSENSSFRNASGRWIRPRRISRLPSRLHLGFWNRLSGMASLSAGLVQTQQIPGRKGKKNTVTRSKRNGDHTALRIYGAALFSSPFHLGFLSFSHLAFAAVRAILLRSTAVSFCSRAFAPLRPIAESAEAD